MRTQYKTFAFAPRSAHKPALNSYIVQYLWRNRNSHHSSSAKLFADAEAEERDAENRSKLSQADIIRQKEENWDGEERIQDAVLRMLVDK
jgi:hypothetical protein